MEPGSLLVHRLELYLRACLAADFAQLWGMSAARCSLTSHRGWERLLKSWLLCIDFENSHKTDPALYTSSGFPLFSPYRSEQWLGLLPSAPVTHIPCSINYHLRPIWGTISSRKLPSLPSLYWFPFSKKFPQHRLGSLTRFAGPLKLRALSCFPCEWNLGPCQPSGTTLHFSVFLTMLDIQQVLRNCISD